MAMPQMGGARAQVMSAGDHRAMPFTGAASTRTPVPMGKDTHVCRMVATQDCYITFGDDTVVATTDDIWLPAGLVELWQVNPNATYVAVVRDTLDGVLHMTELT